MDSNMKPKRDIAFRETQIFIGILLLIFILVGISFNAVVIHTFRKCKDLQTPLNVLMLGSTLIETTTLLIEFPFMVASSFYGYWVFGSAWCDGYGFVMTLLNVSSICILTSLALDRYFVLTLKHFARKITTFKAVMTIFSCLGYGLLWAAFPLVGWGSYAIEPSMIECGPDWSSQSHSSRSYNIVISILVMCVPVSIIIFCCIQITLMKKKSHIFPDNLATDAHLREVNDAQSVFLAILAYLIAWSPYAGLSIWYIYNDPRALPDAVTFFFPLLAKSASAWHPFLYALKSSAYRQAIYKYVLRRKQERLPSSQLMEISLKQSVVASFPPVVASFTPRQTVDFPRFHDRSIEQPGAILTSSAGKSQYVS